MNKNILAINLGNFGSTGTIARQVLDLYSDKESYTYFAYAGWPNNLSIRHNDILICSNFFRKVFSKLAAYTGLNGCFAVIHTFFLLKKIDQLGIGLIHFHNLHNSYVNLPMLMRFVKKKRIPVVWTLHDCWSITGRCPHFVLSKCDKWKKGCHNCPYPKTAYPQSKKDSSKLMWILKKKWFTGIENCVIVTPSQWLADLVKQSYLNEYPIKVINNGIDLDVFKPTDSDFRFRYNFQGKKVILGVSFGWDYRKGLDVFIELAKRLPFDYKIVLVGTDSDVEQQLPASILSIRRTHNQQELAEIYSAADVFVNPTREEVLGLVNVESLACGTPVITFRTGGCPECIDESCGIVVECDDIDAMEVGIKHICNTKPYSMQSCMKRAKLFDKYDRFQEYVDLYQKVLG